MNQKALTQGKGRKLRSKDWSFAIGSGFVWSSGKWRFFLHDFWPLLTSPPPRATDRTVTLEREQKSALCGLSPRETPLSRILACRFMVRQALVMRVCLDLHPVLGPTIDLLPPFFYGSPPDTSCCAFALSKWRRTHVRSTPLHPHHPHVGNQETCQSYGWSRERRTHQKCGQEQPKL